MARSGIDKQSVKQARQALIARGENPSIDAVRVELGNTGSKTTIHRHLRELEAEEAAKVDADAFLTDTLRNMVANLADQLQKEAQDVVDKARTDHAEQIAALFREIADRETQLSERDKQLQVLSACFAEEKEEHANTRSALESAVEDKREQELRLKDQEARLSEKASQIASLEEKHQHVRDSLEHYRQSVKEQRDAENRRFEHQMQQLHVEKRELTQKLGEKQEELSKMARDNSALTTRLTDAHAALENQKSENQAQASELVNQSEELRRFGDIETKYATLEETHDDLLNRHQLVQDDMRSKEVELAGLRAEVATMTKLLAVFENPSTGQTPTNTKRGRQ
ncbi:DNA-binding protein [Kordiimonas lacus]|uniref:Replication region DNA-binding N-term n=1 Tax=Kordiimonas lacus TaxID=637679 RepID=A0A1G6WN43_9PROT|nr:DNA-binding protein [Kordiimonas lacus]SDD66627.1 replication region DNA-binding N-term [Kordiimonas lacus]